MNAQQEYSVIEEKTPKANDGIVVGTTCLESPGTLIQDIVFF